MVSSIAASTLWRNSLSGIGSSPCASRWAFSTVRRYLVTVTPGTDTGYWKAMNRPMRARSSVSASVMSSPLKHDLALGHLQAGVAHDRVGERRLAGAVGSHQGVDLALADGQIQAAQDLLFTGADVKVSNL